jgi:hypothetical protein
MIKYVEYFSCSWLIEHFTCGVSISIDACNLHINKHYFMIDKSNQFFSEKIVTLYR